jgi:1-acyl-sn-glycerol-3-phosphate acyltransferase
MLIYRILKVLVPTAFRVFLRRIYLSNRKNIPAGKPVLLAANHTNAFLDGAIVSYFLWRRVYPLVRGDVFKKSWANRMLRSIGMLPIYRSIDGADMKQSLHKNNQTFKECFEIFERNHLVLIFSEAVAKLEKRLRPIKKGTARLAFDAAEHFNWNMDLHVVPTAINYTFYKGFRKEVMVDFAAPIRVLDYRSEYETNPNKAIATLTAEIEKRLEEKLIIIKDPKHDDTVEMLLIQVRNNLRLPFFGILFYGDKRIKTERETARHYNVLFEENPESALKLAESVSGYNSLLQSHGLQDMSIAGIRGLWWKFIIVVVFSIPALLVSIISTPPYLLAAVFTKKLSPRDEFFDSLMFGFSIGFSVLYHLAIVGFLISFYGWVGLLIFVLIKVVGIFSLFVWEAWQNVVQYIRVVILSLTMPTQIQKLKVQRQEIQQACS